MEEMDVKVQDILMVLKNRWKIILVTTFVITLSTALISFFLLKPVYEVNAKVFIGKEQTNDPNYNNNDVQMYQKLLKTYSELIKTKDLIENAIYKNNFDVGYSDVINNLEVNPSADTQILEISYKNKDKNLSKDILVAVIDEFINNSKELIPNGTVKIVESPELPENPVSPNKVKNIAISFVAGLMLGCAIALLKEYMDDTLKSKEQTEKLLELPVIGMIPCGEKK
ncbi:MULTISPECIES: Wzz/FepE/Etk N-terminal domain-containing protein [unclassified Clostridium]|uniref:YveK family protein n=1 Tax=unclassified Clostridium TaxID=2614128 RepID=UPI0002982B0D|nr:MULTISPECIES: Wzz/FepE/Etk N-terminal domain-containing protein [unclassified Clostridium]EKQ56955.1 MAG: capsular polysaccharide biosynthesis protein [Clostridium sp. Maddingley MBC34-26]